MADRLTIRVLLPRFRLIVGFIEEHGWAPTHRECGEMWGNTAASVKSSLDRMEKRGWIELGSHARQIRITDEGRAVLREHEDVEL